MTRPIPARVTLNDYCFQHRMSNLLIREGTSFQKRKKMNTTRDPLGPEWKKSLEPSLQLRFLYQTNQERYSCGKAPLRA